MRRWILGCLWCASWACGEAPPPPEPAPALLHPLAQAEIAPWRQQVWFEGLPGETVESIRLSEGEGATPIVTLVDGQARRRAVALAAPGRATAAQVVVRPPGEGPPRGASNRDGSVRVFFERNEGMLSVSVADTSRGGARQTIFRDTDARVFASPSVNADGTAMYVREDGGLGGLYRIGLVGGSAVRVVPERDAAHPVLWPGARGDRLVYAEPGRRPRVVVAEAMSSTPPRPASDVYREGRVPHALLPVVSTGSGTHVRLDTCTPTEPLAFEATKGPVLKLAGHSYPGFESAQFCGRGCSELLGRSPEGAPRVVGVVSARAGAHLWDVWFDPDVGAPAGTFVQEDHADDLMLVPGCFEPLSEDTWLVEPRYVAPEAVAIERILDRGETAAANAGVKLAGSSGKRPLLVTVGPDRAPLRQWQGKPTPATGEDAITAARDARAIVEDGGIAWVELATGARSQILETSPSRVLKDPELSFDDASLFFVDEGEVPGLYHVALATGAMTRILPLAGLRDPTWVQWGKEQRVAWLHDGPVGTRAGTSQPFDDAMRSAWNAGPITLLDVHQTWVPVQALEGRLQRCLSEDVVQLGVDAEGGYLRWADVRVPVRAVLARDDGMRVLGDVDGLPTLVAELFVDGDRATWWARSFSVRQTAYRWLPDVDTRDLPTGDRCREHVGN